MNLFKHFKRVMHGALAICMIVGFVSLVLGVCAMLDDFVTWRYRNQALETLLVLTICYMIGLLVELF